MTSTPAVGPEELVDYWPLVTRLAWFLLGVVVVLAVGRLLVQPALARLLRRRNRNNQTIQDAVLLYFQVVVVVIAVLIGAAVAGYGAFLGDSALVFSAVALAIGVAAQEVIGSIVSGIALVLDREFNVGDYIVWPGGEGTVQSIALRVTRVDTPSGELVTIPNTILTNHEITRPYGRGDHRVIQEFSLSYDDDIDASRRLLEATAASLPRILDEPAPVAYVDKLASDAVVVRVHYWIRDPGRRDVFAVRSAYASAVKRRFEAAGIEISPSSEHVLKGRLDIDQRS
jgi:small-conductance mechanosensitive channel